MAKQKFGLGRGLDALISGASEVMSAQQPMRAPSEAIPMVPVSSIMPNPHQPRRAFREDDPRLLELSASIKEHGLLQPIVVTHMNVTAQEANNTANAWLAEDAQPYTSSAAASQGVIEYQIIAGERRWRAARLAGLTQVPVVIKEANSQQMLELALIENIQRADLNPIEEALAYQALVQEFGLTQEMVAKQVGKDRSTVTNSLRLLQLPHKVREALINQPENFTEGHARTLINIPREEDQITAMEKIIAQRLTVRQAEELATRIKASEDIESALERIVPRRRTPEIDDLENSFRQALMMKVDLKCNARGKGTLVLHFNNQEELEGLYSKLIKTEE